MLSTIAERSNLANIHVGRASSPTVRRFYSISELYVAAFAEAVQMVERMSDLQVVIVNADEKLFVKLFIQNHRLEHGQARRGTFSLESIEAIKRIRFLRCQDGPQDLVNFLFHTQFGPLAHHPITFIICRYSDFASLAPPPKLLALGDHQEMLPSDTFAIALLAHMAQLSPQQVAVCFYEHKSAILSVGFGTTDQERIEKWLDFYSNQYVPCV